MNANGSYKNPLFGLYKAMVPAPNQNFLSPTQQPLNNYYRAAEPDQPHNTQFSARVDYNLSPTTIASSFEATATRSSSRRSSTGPTTPPIRNSSASTTSPGRDTPGR